MTLLGGTAVKVTIGLSDAAMMLSNVPVTALTFEVDSALIEHPAW